jgi:hypothetical protein
MGTTTDLRRALKADVYPLLARRGFAIDQRHSPQFTDFRRTRGHVVDFIEFQWEKYGRPRFKFSFGTVSASGTVGGGMHTLAADMGPGQAPSYVCLYPKGNGTSTRHWFCQDARPLLHFLGFQPRPASQVSTELVALLPEVDEYFLSGKAGLHCFEHANLPFQNAV